MNVSMTLLTTMMRAARAIPLPLLAEGPSVVAMRNVPGFSVPEGGARRRCRLVPCWAARLQAAQGDCCRRGGRFGNGAPARGRPQPVRAGAGQGNERKGNQDGG